MLECTKVETEITDRLGELCLSICAHGRGLQRVQPTPQRSERCHIGSRRLVRGLHPPVWLYLTLVGIRPQRDVRQWVDISRECFSCARPLLGDLQADCAADQG